MVNIESERKLLPAWLTQSNHIAPLETITLGVDETLFSQGDTPDNAYIVLAGGLVIVREEPNGSTIEIDKLYSGDVVGEMGLISGQSRTASVRAMVPTKLLIISAADYAILRSEDEQIEIGLLNKSVDRWQRVQLAAILGNLFGEIDAATVHDIQNRLIWHHLAAGDVLCQQHEEATSMYLLVSGRLRFDVVNEDGNAHTVGDAGPGETVGEFALITKSTRSATVMAIRESTVVELTQPLYQSLSSDYPSLGPAITRIIVERQQRTIGHLPSKRLDPKLSLTLLPVYPAVDLTAFANQLFTALAPHGKARIIRSSDVDNALSRPGVAHVDRQDPYNTSISQWLGEQESQYDHLIYIPDPTWTTWTERCVSQSDRVLLVAQPHLGLGPAPGPIEDSINRLKLAPRQELILWHPAETEQPQGTLPWLTSRPNIKRHLHVRDKDQAHFARIARLILGKGIGVVFSGGGARGYVQMGVCRAMEDLDIPIDYIGGASFGSVMAGPPAMEKPVTWTEKRAARFSKSKYTRDRTLPLVALNKSNGLVEMTQEAFGEVQIEDLWLPYFATVTNLTRARSETLDRGPLWLACRKSIAIPGVYSPVVEDGDVLVDGGVMNNFPIDVMAERLEGTRIIGVSVSPLEGKARNYDIDYSVSGWRLLFNRLNPFATKRRVPTLAYSLLRTMEVNSLYHSRNNIKLADLFLVISAKKYGFLDFAKFKDIIQIGYDESFEQLKAWKAEQPDLV